MKYSLNLLLWTVAVDESCIPILEKLKEWGYDGVEFPVFATDLKLIEPVARKVQELGLGVTTVSACSPEQDLISPDASVRAAGVEFLKSCVDITTALGGTHMVGPLHSALGKFSGVGPTTDEWKRSQDGIVQVADHAARQNVTLCVEAINRFECYLMNSHGEAARYCREVGHPNVKMMYDTFHANIEEKNITEAIKGCRDQLAHIHISENDRSTPGEGQVNWDETFAALKDVGYDGWLTIEAFGLAMPELAAATRIWRRMFPSEEYLATNGLKFMKSRTS